MSAELLKNCGGAEKQVRGRVVFLDCPFDPVDSNVVLDRLVSWCRAERRSHTLLTMNASILAMMTKDEELATACRAGDLIVADGVPVVWASRLVGAPLPARVAGVDLMARLLERAATEHLRVYFLGGREEVLHRLVELCAERFPELVISGSRNGYFAQAENAAVIQQIRDSHADILFVGMPTPFKEVWCERHRAELEVPVLMGVGGSFDVIAGFVLRAPLFLQRAGLEWFWRLLMEPRKMWRRYLLNNSLFVARVGKEFVRRRVKGNV